MSTAVVIVAKNEEDYIDLALRSVRDHVDGVYLLDTGSSDSTIDQANAAMKMSKTSFKQVFGDFGGDRLKFGSDYREKEARNWAIEQTEKEWDPEYIISLDGDEVYNLAFWEWYAAATSRGVASIGHATELPTTPYTVSRNHNDIRMLGTMQLFDPHIRIWNTRKVRGRWEQNPGEHVYLALPGDAVCPFSAHFHLHYAFGYKCMYYRLKFEYPETFDRLVGEIKKDSDFNKDNPHEDLYYLNNSFRNGRLGPANAPEIYDEMGRVKVMPKREEIACQQECLRYPLPDDVVIRWLSKMNLDNVYKQFLEKGIF